MKMVPEGIRGNADAFFIEFLTKTGMVFGKFDTFFLPGTLTEHQNGL